MAAEAGSQKSSDSGKVYDFKDSKTSGVVTFTKLWDDSMSNDERTVPDISISTEKPSKNPLGYTITYHGNGLTFADGSSENEIIVNNSGKIVSGQYELPGNTAVTWYLDSQCISKIKTDNNGLPLSGIFSDLDLYAKSKTFVLKTGSKFNSLIPSTATSVVFTDEIMPIYATLIDVDEDGDGGVVAWMDGAVMKVSTQTPGKQVIAATSCQEMFKIKSNLISIDFNNLGTSNVINMSGMFEGCTRLTALDLTPLDTQNVTDMSHMFLACIGLTNLDLTPLDTSNVTNMDSMFGYCSGLTNLNLSPLNTRNVTNMSSMFSGCSGLTALDLSSLNTQNVKDMSSMFSYCSGLTTLDLIPLNTRNVTDMYSMFSGCSGLTSLDLTPLNTSNVTNMSFMFSGCSGLTSLNLTSLDTSNVTNMSSMFYGCTVLTTLSIGEKFAFVGSEYNLPSGTWYSSDGTAYTSDGNSCTIPNNKADTYTRR